MGLLSIQVLCEKCDQTSDILVDREDRNEPQLCGECDGGMAYRVWTAPHVSTTKTSASIPEAVANGRFDHLRAQQDMKKELSAAKAKYGKNPTKENKKDIDKLRKEKKKLEGK